MHRPDAAAWFPSTLLLLLAACEGEKQETGNPHLDTSDTPTDSSDSAVETGDPVDTDTGVPVDTSLPHTGDTGETDVPPTDPFAWTLGPDLPACTPQAGDGDLVALSGVVLLPEGPEAGLVVYSRNTGLITCAGSTCDTAGAEVVCTEGVISPGLINAHDHLQYNVLPPWQHEELYEHRYQWQAADEYDLYRTAYLDISGSQDCEIMKWAELRNLVAGATSAVGSSGGDCINVFIRNLDEPSDASHITSYEMYYTASDVTEKFDASDAEKYVEEIASGETDALLAHVGEGINGTVRAEIDWMLDIGLSGPHVGYIHATDATAEQLARMSATGTTIVWSPRSNVDLYGAATPVDVAWRMGVPIVLSPDWTWSGSMSPAHELSCANDFLRARRSEITDVELWSWVTGKAASLLALEGRIGSLEVGAWADIAVFAWSAEPYRAVIQSGAEDVFLTVVAGDALYGRPELVEDLAGTWSWCETLTPCSEERVLCAQAASSGDDAQTYADLESILTDALSSVTMPAGYEYANDLLGLWLCPEDVDPFTTCEVDASATDADPDGDGVTTGDTCPWAWNPDQFDWDEDGTGDACDPCPLNPVSEDCGATSADDLDGDGTPNDEDSCPYVWDEGADGDGDGKGDACDPCPEESNPGDAACSFDVDAIADETHPDHPAVGTTVSVDGLVVTGIWSGQGFYAQDPDLPDYAGVLAYLGSNATVARGDVVHLDGTYEEYDGMVEITDPVVTVTGSASEPPPVVLDDPCAVATGGPDAERYEAMLVQVWNVEVTSANPDDPDEYGEFEVGGCLRVDDRLFTTLDDAASGYRVEGAIFESITGVLNFTYENTKLIPRDEADLVLSSH